MASTPRQLPLPPPAAAQPHPHSQPHPHAQPHPHSQPYYVPAHASGNAAAASAMVVPSPDFVQMRIHTQFALGAVTRDEMQTYVALMQGDDSGDVLVMPNHHTDDVGNIHGFRYATSPHADVSVLPLTQSMFHGLSCAECHDPRSATTHRDAVGLLTDEQACRRRMHGLLQELRDAQAACDTASFDCIPINSSAVYEAAPAPAAGPKGAPRGVRSIQHLHEGRDCKAWAYDIPSFMGIYHAYVRGKDSDTREHKLFLVCGGGCRKACDQYSNMVKDISGHASVEELLVCDETWWLRRACQRNRCGVIAKLARAFDLKVQCIADSNSYDTSSVIASALTDTPSHDIQRLQNGKIAVYNECCDTTSVQNGILHNMYPSEGVWVFQGATRTASPLRTSFGGTFGHQKICGCFPVSTFQVPRDESSAKTIRAQRNVVSLKNTPNVIWYDMKGCVLEKPPSQLAQFVRCDEAYLKHLEGMQWNRDNQVIEFIPIVVAALAPMALSL